MQRSDRLTQTVTAEDIMWRSISAFGTLVALSTASQSCDRRTDGPVSRTEITAVEIEGVPTPPGASAATTGDSERELGAFRESALADLANLDERVHRLELRLGDWGPRANRAEARGQLDEARRRRDRLATRIEAMQPGTWQRDREDVQRQWEEVSAVAERAGDLLSDDAR